MTVAHSASISVCLICLMCVACEDTQSRLISGAGIEQIGISSVVETKTKREANLDVHLEAIQQSRPEVTSGVRNPFRFGDSVSETLTGQRRAAGAGTIEPESVSSNVFQRSPRVALRMIGLVEPSGTAERIVVLTDGSIVFHGREGQLVEGRYRIISIGQTSVEIESVHDGKRQVLRLAGS